MKNFAFLLLVVFASSSLTFAYDTQPREMKLLAHIGKVATATLDEITLSKLNHTPSSSGGFEYYKPQEGQSIYLTVEEVQYKLIEMKRAGANDRFQLDFVEVETGQALSMRDNKNIASFQVLSGFISATVTGRY